MSAPIGPGDWVECIDDSPSRKTGEPRPLVRGPVYVVERLTRSAHPRDRHDPVGLVLRDVPMPDWTLGFGRERFRPIDRRTTELFRSLLAPSPERVTEDA